MITIRQIRSVEGRVAESGETDALVARFAELAAEHSGLETPIAVSCRSRPDWLKAVLATKGARELDLEAALTLFAAANPA